MNRTIKTFMEELSSGAATPGGGGASALLGAVGVALCSMVANLTTGKKKYAAFQEDIEKILADTKPLLMEMLSQIQKDAENFAPLAEAYGIPKETPGRDEILEKALVTAASTPMEIIKLTEKAVDIAERLATEGSRLAISDVAVAATACRAALEGAAVNVYINTKLMKDTKCAKEINAEVNASVTKGVERCSRIYQEVAASLQGEQGA